MAGYRPAAMVRTPWGNAGELRAKMMRPGWGTPREEADRNQRERLFAALVATVAEKGYDATTLADLVSLSGVSRSAFYRHFDDKEDCFLAAVEALVGPTVGAIAKTDGRPAGEERAREVFDSLIRLLVEQVSAARMCFVEIYAAGPRAVGVLGSAVDAFEEFVAQTLREMPGRDEMPPQVVRAMIGGLHKVIHTRLYRGEEHELPALTPQMWQWGLSYLPPPQPLRRPRRRAGAIATSSDGHDPAERLLRALASVVAEKGYPETTVADIVGRASVSQRTFYEHFAGREEALLAALDRGSAQMLAAILPAFRRAPDWPHAVRGSFGAMFAFAAVEPDYTQLGAVEVYAAGKRALEQRDQVMAGLEGLLAPGYELAPATSPIAAEAIGGAIYALIYDQVKAKGPESLPEIVPLATYVALAPFLGAKRACAVANGEE
jgi:AcrR family transcriptional regulator